MTPDQSSRDAARKRLGANIVVEAGAGTGKTTLLTDRLLFSLLAGGPEGEGLSITRLVALTFTEKAAGEIKTRLADRLMDLLRRLDGQPLPGPRAEQTDFWLREARSDFKATDGRLRRMAGEALRDLDRAPISTLHSFCRTLLQLYPLEAGLNPQFQVDQGPAYDQLFRREWGRWLETELVPEGPQASLWREVLAQVGLGDIGNLAWELARTPPVEPLGENLADRLASLRGALARLPVGKPVPRRGKMLESIARVAERLRTVEAVVRKPDGLWPAPQEWKETPKDWPRDWAGMGGESIYEEACAVANAVSPEGEAALLRVRRLLAPFAEKCRALYRAEGWMGFDDLLREARTLLANHLEVRRELKSRYGMILVDEFQDTDPLQGELLLFLAERPESEAATWRDVALAPGKLFIVGDPKQSIYRFRGADIRAYGAFVAHVLGQGGEKCDLQTSFRTHEGIVEPVNRLFADLMRESPGLQAAYLPLHPRPGGPGTGGVELALVSAGEDGLTSREGQEREARWVAQWIVDHCGAEGSRRPWKLGDVAVLFRSTAALPVYLEALKDARIPYLVESDRAFYSTPEVMDFLNLLRVVQDPTDQISWVGILRSPLVLLEDRQILTLAEAHALGDTPPLPDGLPKEAAQRVSSFYGEVQRLRAWAAQETLGAFAARLLRETALLPAAAAAYHGEQSVSNLLKLARLAAEANDARGETLAGFTRWLSDAIGEGVDEGESPLGEERVDAVRLLTVHKAKGLEYKVVFLPNLAAKVQGARRRPAAYRQDWGEGAVGHRLVAKKWVDVGMAFLERDERRREAEEAIRLFYVAATRAREHVILVGGEKAAPGSFLQMLSGAAKQGDAAWELADGLRIPVTRVPPRRRVGPRWAGVPAPRVKRWTAERTRAWNRRVALAAPIQGQPLFRSPSAKVSGPERIPRPEGFGGLPPEEAALLGSLCHAVLEAWPWGTTKNVAEAIAEAIARLAYQRPAAAWDRLKPEATALLEGFFQSDAARSIQAKDVLARETPFLFAEGGQVVRGVIDLLHRRGGATWVADFKTDRLSPGEAPFHAQRYAAQGRDYVEGVRKALGVSCGFEVIFLRTGERVPLIEPG